MREEIIIGAVVVAILTTEILLGAFAAHYYERKRQVRFAALAQSIASAPQRQAVRLIPVPPGVIPVPRTLMRFWVRTPSGHFVLVNFVGCHRSAIAEVFEQFVPYGSTCVEPELPEPVPAQLCLAPDHKPLEGADPC